VSALLAVLAAAVSVSTPSVIVLPPTAVAPDTESAWVGEAVADYLPRALATLGVPAVERIDRLKAHEALQIPPAPLTKATSIRIAEAVGASRLVEGSYEARGASLRLSLRLLDVERGTLSAPLMASGPPEALLQLVRGLASDIALTGSTPPALAREAFFEHGRRTDPPFEALRAYARGLSAVDPAERARLLRQALSLAPAYDEARLALGWMQMDARDSAAALETLAKLPDSSPLARAAHFQRGRAQLDLGRYREAADLHARLAAESPTPGVLNNHALALLRLGADRDGGKASEILRKAIERGPVPPELPFNLGFALLVEGDPEAAAFWLRGVVADAPRDVEARQLLAWALRQAGREAAAAAEWKEVEAPDLKLRFERILPVERPLILNQERWSDTQLAASHLGRAEKLSESGDLDGALRELTQAAYLDPYGARIHLGLARVHRARGDTEIALSEFRMSLWCDDDPVVRAELSVMLRASGRIAEAKAEAGKVLKAAPDNAEARRVLTGSR
jgi:tetratricopeptide (TPR) repeat protein